MISWRSEFKCPKEKTVSLRLLLSASHILHVLQQRGLISKKCVSILWPACQQSRHVGHLKMCGTWLDSISMTSLSILNSVFLLIWCSSCFHDHFIFHFVPPHPTPLHPHILRVVVTGFAFSVSPTPSPLQMGRTGWTQTATQCLTSALPARTSNSESSANSRCSRNTQSSALLNHHNRHRGVRSNAPHLTLRL